MGALCRLVWVGCLLALTLHVWAQQAIKREEMVEVWVAPTAESWCAVASDCGNATCPCSSIQSALDQASVHYRPLDTQKLYILLKEGTYEGTGNEDLAMPYPWSFLYIECASESPTPMCEVTLRAPFINRGSDWAQSLGLKGLRFTMASEPLEPFVLITYHSLDLRHNGSLQLDQIAFENLTAHRLFRVSVEHLELLHLYVTNVTLTGSNTFHGGSLLEQNTVTDNLVTPRWLVCDARVIDITNNLIQNSKVDSWLHNKALKVPGSNGTARVQVNMAYIEIRNMQLVDNFFLVLEHVQGTISHIGVWDQSIMPLLNATDTYDLEMHNITSYDSRWSEFHDPYIRVRGINPPPGTPPSGTFRLNGMTMSNSQGINVLEISQFASCEIDDVNLVGGDVNIFGTCTADSITMRGFNLTGTTVQGNFVHLTATHTLVLADVNIGDFNLGLTDAPFISLATVTASQHSTANITNVSFHHGHVAEQNLQQFRRAFLDIINFRNVSMSHLKMTECNVAFTEIEYCNNLVASDWEITGTYGLRNHLMWVHAVPSFVFERFQARNNSVLGPFGLVLVTSSSGAVRNSTVQELGSPSLVASPAFWLENSNCSVVNSTFQDIYTPHGSAAFSIQSQLHLTDCVFERCVSTIDSGGAIYALDSNLTISSSSFQHCFSQEDGGVLSLFNSTFSSKSNRYIENQSVRDGGVISAEGEAGASFVSYFDVFEGNLALDAAAVVVQGDLSTIFEGTWFRNNSASSAGGAMIASGHASIECQGCQFFNNYCRSSGGAVFLMQFSQATLQDVNFDSNRAVVGGGALCTQDFAAVHVESSNAAHNSAEQGGAFLFTSSGNSTIQNTQILNNTAISTGGGVSMRVNGAVAISDSLFLHNEAPSGAGLWSEDSVFLHVSMCLFEDNVAVSRGGGVLLGDNTQGYILNSTFRNNVASVTGGGALWIQDQAAPVIAGCQFDSNNGTNGGAIASTSSRGPYIVECVFTNNRATLIGAAIYLRHSNGSLYNSTCENNHSGGDAGCLGVQGGSFPYVTDVLMQNNSAFGYGGAIFCSDKCKPTITQCVIADNSAQVGGGMYVDFNVLGTLYNVTFTRNLANTGGGMYNQGSAMTCKDLLFSYNHANSSGGGLSFVNNGALELKVNSGTPLYNNIDLMYNEASLGGGIYILPSRTQDYHSGSVEIFSNITLTSNVANNGGGLCVAEGRQPPTFGQVQIYNNTARQMGGGMFVDTMESNTKWLYNADFRNNTAIWAGASAAWQLIQDVTSDNADSYQKTFCDNCHFVIDREFASPYNNARGFATYPWVSVFASPCPSAKNLSQSFNVALQVHDQFNTVVSGPYLEENKLYITMTSPATGSAKSDIDPNTGQAEFENIVLEGMSGQSYVLTFTTESVNNTNRIKREQCSVYLNGCAPGYRIAHEEDYETCHPVIVQPEEVLWLLIFVLVLLFITVGVVIFLYAAHQRMEKKRHLRAIAPLFHERPHVTVENILTDPDIPHIAWNSIQVGERIGKGASGLVTSGLWDIGDGNTVKVAMKELLIGFDGVDEIVIIEFLREVKLMSALAHPHIVKFLGITCPDDSTICLITELMEEGSIKDFAARHSELTWEQRIDLLIGGARGLGHLHDNNLIHRDIKPHNMLVNRDFDCKVADFGISTVIPAHTRTMTCVGTPVYMAPEVLQREKYSAKADVYSFGILALELITGLKPYSVGPLAKVNNAVLMYHIVDNDARPEHGPLPDTFQQLVDECLDPDPEVRPSCEELIARLERMRNLDIDIQDIFAFKYELEAQRAAEMDRILETEFVLSVNS